MSNSLAERDPRLIAQQAGLKGAARNALDRVRSGDLGSIPVVIGLIVIWAVFQWQSNGDFFNPGNINDLANNIAFGGLISLGIVMVLLLGEIDLSVGSVSGLCAAVVAVLNVHHGWGGGWAIIAGVAVGAVLGLVQGVLFTAFVVPSFVITLAGLLAFYGLQLRVLGSTGTINFPIHHVVDNLVDYHFGTAATYVIVTVALAFYILTMLTTRLQQARAKVPSTPVVTITFRAVIVGVILYLGAWELNRYHGMPLSLFIFLAFCILFSILTTRTTYGRHVFAVGGNVEAARRAGINVTFIRVSVFAIAGAMAALGGVVNAAYVSSASQSSGGNQLLLFAIAAAVIGGTSLFGGRGSAWAALLGWLVVGSIYKGIFLIGLSASAQNLIIAAVLAAAAIIDALARRGRASHGRA